VEGLIGLDREAPVLGVDLEPAAEPDDDRFFIHGMFSFQ
jgi:hypothetical protein